MKKLSGIIVLFLIVIASWAQPPQVNSSADIYLQLKKLNVLGSVLYIAAHPDDENTRLLAFLSKEKMYRTGYLSLTRGDGGQNLVGDEQGVELGLIRTQELLAARRIDGAEQFFTRAYDFGYSKSADETLRFWDREKILSDVVWVIRKFRPDVIITRFPGDERAGHGHHTTSALIANEAFTAAADPLRFPEQLKSGVQPWQAKRILWNTFNFGGNNTISEDQFKIDVGGYNALLGKGYGEVASESRSQHKSQGFGVPRQRGASKEYFTNTGGVPPVDDLMNQVVTTWNRIAGAGNISNTVDSLVKNYSFEHPELSVMGLRRLYELVSQTPDGYWREQKLQQIQQVMEACTGLLAEASVNREFAVQGDSLKVQLFLNKRNSSTVRITAADVFQLNAANRYDSIMRVPLSRELPLNENILQSVGLWVPADAPLSQPYWLQNGMPVGYFRVDDQALIGKAESDPAFMVAFNIEIGGLPFKILRPVQFKITDPVKGELLQPLRIIPAVALTIDAPHKMVVNQQPVKGEVRFTANKPNMVLRVKDAVRTSGKATTDFDANSVTLSSNGETRSLGYSMSKASHDTVHMGAIDTKTGLMLNRQVRTIHYDHIPTITYFPEALVVTNPVDLKIQGSNIGYIPGAGDKVAESLKQLGYKVTVLTEEMINPSALQSFDAVITGVRAFNVHEFLVAKLPILQAYVSAGGNLIVQYNTNNQLGGLKAGLGPFPFTISRTRVSDETAPITVTMSNHPVFNLPNKITPADFEGWVQERSVYQAEGADSNYIAPLQMNDPGEKPSSGSLLIAKWGKGNFVYTALSFFRQLPAGVPGAYRLFANLIALPKNK